MRIDDLESFSELLNGVFDLYGKPISEFAVQIWWDALKQYDLPAVMLAFSRHVQNPDVGQFLPKPADVIRMLGGTTKDSAMSAWSKVDKAVRQVGTYASVAFDDPLIHRAIHDMGGWIALGTRSEDEWPFEANRFVSYYRGYASRSEQPEYPSVLIGISEADNAQRGFRNDPPRLIGDADRAMLVMQGGTDKPLIGFSSMRELAASNVIPLPTTKDWR